MILFFLAIHQKEIETKLEVILGLANAFNVVQFAEGFKVHFFQVFHLSLVHGAGGRRPARHLRVTLTTLSRDTAYLCHGTRKEERPEASKESQKSKR